MLADARGIKIGAAVAVGPLRLDPKYREVLKREYSVIVAENAFKWEWVHPVPSAYDFDGADAIVDFAKRNGMAIRGHTLVWHRQVPAWVYGLSREDAIAALRDHIATLVTRYRGRVAAWDVVNEAIGDDGTLRQESLWYRLIGPSYIAMAFRFAREADPQAKLYYNDYGAEGAGAKSDAVYELVRSLQEQGVPIDGVGWQMHVANDFRAGPDNSENAQRLAALGLELSITELDVRTPTPTDDAALESQAKAYESVTSLCLSLSNCKALLTWGFTDAYSWVPEYFNGRGAALPFDAGYRPKPAYRAIHDALASKG